MQNIEEQYIDFLKEEVEKTFGEPIQYPKDCYALSVAIVEKTGRQLSETTLKRIWQLVKSQFNPSKYTLDSLSLYVGFIDWKDFIGKYKVKEEIQEESLWNKIRKKALEVSRYSFKSIVNRMGIPYNLTIKREFAYQKFDEFINSVHSATAFIAPGGYGKSTLITHIIEDYYLSKNPKYPNDIIWFIDCGILDTLITKNFNIESFLLRLIGYDSQDSFRNYFKNNPDQIKGKIVLVIDGLNEISSNQEKLFTFIDNLLKIVSTNHDTTWFKIALTIRTDLWNYFGKKVQENPLYSEGWWGVDFIINSNIVSNVPFLRIDELEAIFERNKVDDLPIKLNINNFEIYELARIPYFLYLYISLSKDRDYIVSDIDLFREFIHRKIMGHPNGEDKLKLIDFFLFSTNYGVDTDIVIEKQVKDIILEKHEAYQELVSFGILNEYRVEDKYLTQTYFIKISHQILFEFLLANFWLREYGFSKELFKTVAEFYEENTELKYNILSWLIKYAFKEKEKKIILYIYNFINTELVKKESTESNYIKNLVNVLGLEIRKDKKLRDELIPNFTSKSVKALYFKSFWDFDSLILFFADNLKHFISDESSIDDIFYYEYMQFLKAFYSSDKKAMSLVFDRMSELNISELNYYNYSLFLSCQIMYFCIAEGGVPKSIQEYIIDREKEFVENDDLKINKLEYHHIAIIDAFVLTKNYTVVIELYNLLTTSRFLSKIQQGDRFLKHLNLYYSYALLKIGRKQAANESFDKGSFHYEENYPINARYFWLTRYHLIAIEFYIENALVQKAKEDIELVMKYSEMYKFLYMKNQAMQLNDKIEKQ